MGQMEGAYVITTLESMAWPVFSEREQCFHQLSSYGVAFGVKFGSFFKSLVCRDVAVFFLGFVFATLYG